MRQILIRRKSVQLIQSYQRISHKWTRSGFDSLAEGPLYPVKSARDRMKFKHLFYISYIYIIIILIILHNMQDISH